MSALINLRHLKADTKIVSSIQGLARLTALQELSVSGRKVRELAGMDMLKRLEISDLDQIQSREEAGQARLGVKEYLEVLELRWKDDGDDHSLNQSLEEEVLEGLQPAPDSISTLQVVGYGGVKSPSWMEGQLWASCPLERVELENCRNWEVMPPLGQLRWLKFLAIRGMRRVRQIGPQFLSHSRDGGRSSGAVEVQGFPSLEELEFTSMPEWEQWEVPIGDDRGQRQVQQQPSFLPRLRKLEIGECPKLRELPPLPPTLTRLVVSRVGLVCLPEWFRSRGGGGNFDEAPSSSSSYSLSYLSIEHCSNLRSLGDGLLRYPLRVLEVLRIEYCRELESLPEGGFRHLTSLKSLTMKFCPKLSWPSSSVVTGEVFLPSSLEQVAIYGCTDTVAELLPVRSLQKLSSLRRLDVSVGTSSDRVAGFRELTSLTSLGIYDGGHLNSEALSICLQGLTFLEYLSIFDCPLMTTLPSEEVLRRLTALKQLRIWSCEQMTSLGGIHALISLKELAICDCPKLLHLVEAATSPPRSSLPLPAPPAGTLMRLESLGILGSSPQQITAWLRQCPSLQQLRITLCPLLTCFDGEDVGGHVGRELELALLNLAPSLRILTFYGCENVRSLPSKLRCLSSLEYLYIGDCPQMQRLPPTGLPESLDFLAIWLCPALKERCGEVGSPDWPLISHIPEVYMDRSWSGQTVV